MVFRMEDRVIKPDQISALGNEVTAEIETRALKKGK